MMGHGGAFLLTVVGGAIEPGKSEPGTGGTGTGTSDVSRLAGNANRSRRSASSGTVRI